MSLDRRNFLRQATGGLAALALMPELEAMLPPPLADTVKIGVIGTGHRGNQALDELATMEGAKIVAIADVDKGRRNRGAKRAPEATVYESGAELLAAAGVDAIILATPTHLHRELAMAALKQGLPVYCEAPLAHSVEESKALVDAVGAQDKLFAAGFTARSSPLYIRARNIYRSGAARGLVSMRSHWRKRISWREMAPTAARETALNWKLDPKRSAGLEGEVGSHHVHTLEWITGKNAIQVSGWGDIRAWKDRRRVPDSVQLEYLFEDEVRLQQELTLASSLGGNEMQILGSHGSFRLAGRYAWLFKEADSATQGWEVYARRERFHEDEGFVLLANATKLAEQGKPDTNLGMAESELYFSLHAFLTAVIEDGEPACSAADALSATLAGIAAQQAVASGTVVTLNAEV
ncbi:MAG: Gfo/Idh/MocA family oxidoreductase [Planctomycetes bacterium]|nr:Gfo/Idh/MocA family oxidoreductase [Planctomycetota bacterium]